MEILTCPLCLGSNLGTYFHTPHGAISRCSTCGLAMLNPQPDDATLQGVYDATYFIGSDQSDLLKQGNALKRGTATLQIADLHSYMQRHGISLDHPKLLEIGCGLGNFLYTAQSAGFDVHGIDISQSAVDHANACLGEARVKVGLVEDLNLKPQQYDVLVLADVLEHVRNPRTFLNHVRTLVKPGGVIFLAVPSLDSFSARLMGKYWVEFKLEHLYYFDRKSIYQLLCKTGFEGIQIGPGKKILNLNYIIAHFEQFPIPLLTPLMRGLKCMLPKSLLQKHLTVVASGINVIARVPHSD